MLNMLQPYALAFISIFVAVDAIGSVPVYMGLIQGSTKKQKHRIIVESVTTATVLAVLFMLIGKLILSMIGITIPDFQIAGGLLVFVISLRLLLPGSQKSAIFEGSHIDVAVFPLGTPLITGPAVLTTTLMMRDAYGIIPTTVALALNMFIVWIILTRSDYIIRLIGVNGTRAFSKIMYILLASIGVMMVRKGVMGIFLK